MGQGLTDDEWFQDAFPECHQEVSEDESHAYNVSFPSSDSQADDPKIDLGNASSSGASVCECGSAVELLPNVSLE